MPKLCVHNQRRSRCKECGGASICEHNRRRTRCKECGGASICEHNRQRSKCKECADCKGSGCKGQHPVKHTTAPLSPRPTNGSHGQQAPGPFAQSHALLSDAPAPAVPVAVKPEPKTVSETEQPRPPCRRLGQSPTPTIFPSLHASGHLPLKASRT